MLEIHASCGTREKKNVDVFQLALSGRVTCPVPSPRAHLHVVGDVAAYVFNISQPSLPTPFSSVLVSVPVFMALSSVFHSINYPDNSPLFHSVLPVLFLPHWSFQLYIFFL